MDIVIIGSGAMGCLFAALLAQGAPAARISLCCRSAELAQRVCARGVVVEGLDGQRRAQPLAAFSSDGQEPLPQAAFDAAIVLVKAPDTGAAGQLAARLLREGGMALTLQNGLGNREALAAHVGAARVLVGSTAQASTLLAPAEVRHAGAGVTMLAPQGEAQRACALQLQALFQAAGMACELAGDADALLWAKLLVNAAINPLGALLRVPNGALAENADARALMAQVLAEAQAVAAALGVALPEGDALERALDVCRRTAANRCSMLQDVLRGRTTEIDAISGSVARLGAEAGVPAPCNATLAQLVRALQGTAGANLF